MLPLFSAAFYIKGSTLFCFSFSDHSWEAGLEEGTVIPCNQQEVRMCFLNMAIARQSLVRGFCIGFSQLQYTDLVHPVHMLKN